MIREYLQSIAEARRKGIIAGMISGILLPFSWLYSGSVSLLAGLRSWRRGELPCIVISVGNITWGGTGKTPLVEFIALFLKNNGRNPAVLSRGYGGSGKLAAGDEPLMLQRRLQGIPVLTDKKRMRSGLKAVKEFRADTLILDDGFQQWGVKKDLEIVAVDALNPFGNGSVIPAGMLREPLSALKRADIFILTRCERIGDISPLKRKLAEINPSAGILSCRYSVAGFFPAAGITSSMLDARAFSGKEVTVFSGIAVPESFEEGLRATGARIAVVHRFPDHYLYTKREIDGIVSRGARQGCGALITTEKDAARLVVLYDGKPPAELWVMRIELEFEGDDAKRLRDRLLRVFLS
ncbi:MAG: tetraacyldisaccharide 4'-kinase [Candidatus Omnitrophota bacterium]|jgi:tetraacyldisaccharide 4'-kinase